MSRAAASEAGFSLIEVVAAMAVLAFAAAALLRLASGGLSLARAANDRTELVAAASAALVSGPADGAWQRCGASGHLECRTEVLPFSRAAVGRGRLTKVVAAARSTATGAEFTLTTLREK